MWRLGVVGLVALTMGACSAEYGPKERITLDPVEAEDTGSPVVDRTWGTELPEITAGIRDPDDTGGEDSGGGDTDTDPVETDTYTDEDDDVD